MQEAALALHGTVDSPGPPGTTWLRVCLRVRFAPQGICSRPGTLVKVTKKSAASFARVQNVIKDPRGRTRGNGNIKAIKNVFRHGARECLAANYGFSIFLFHDGRGFYDSTVGDCMESQHDWLVSSVPRWKRSRMV